jgi:hypothetical protein
MTAEGNPLTKMGHFGHSTHTIFRYFLCYFSRLHRTNFSQIPQDLSLSCDPIGFAIFAICGDLHLVMRLDPKLGNAGGLGLSC